MSREKVLALLTEKRGAALSRQGQNPCPAFCVLHAAAPAQNFLCGGLFYSCKVYPGKNSSTKSTLSTWKVRPSRSARGPASVVKRKVSL